MTKRVTQDQLKDALKKDILLFHQGIVREAARRIVDKTPVESGSLRGSVQIVEGSETTQATEADPSGSSTNIRNDAAAARLSIGPDANIIVGAPYGYYVENGTSKMRPHGFIARTGNELDAIVRAAINHVERNT